METLQQDIVIPIKLIKRKQAGRTYIAHSENYYVVTPLSKLLAKAYIMEKRLRENPGLLFKKFCKFNNITRQYLNNVLQLNILSPKIKNLIMDGYLPKHLSIQDILCGTLKFLMRAAYSVSMKGAYQSWQLELMMIGSSIMTEDGTLNLKTRSLKKLLKSLFKNINNNAKDKVIGFQMMIECIE